MTDDAAVASRSSASGTRVSFPSMWYTSRSKASRNDKVPHFVGGVNHPTWLKHRFI